jgi:hypothetical protein
MDRERAITLVGYLVAGTTGWNDDTVMIYTAEIEKLSQPNVAMIAVREVVRTWSEARRPPIAVILDEYRRQLARAQPAPQLTAAPPAPFRRGVEIAREAYKAERERLGKPVNLQRFDGWIAGIARPTR